jgi:ABC-2 type transport system ATP-binding protein
MYIETINLSKRYGNFYALKNLNLKVEGGKCLGYLGPNGAGKTTTLKLLTNLIRPTSGEVIINGYSVQKNMKKALEDVGTLIETPDFYPYLTPLEILSMICDIRGKDKKNIKNALKETNLYQWRNKKVGKFSKGMKQRLAMAVALVTNPSIMILDEPTYGMDPQGMAEIREIIKELKKDGKLIFMSSHLLPEITEVCDEVAMIDKGVLLLHESIDKVSSRFISNSVVVEFLEPIKEVNIDVDRIKGIHKITPYKIRIEFSGDAEDQSRILEELVKRGYRILSYKNDTLALEEAYLKLVGGYKNE